MGNRLVASVRIVVALHIESARRLETTCQAVRKYLPHEQVAPFQVVIVLLIQQHMHIHQYDLLDTLAGNWYTQI